MDRRNFIARPASPPLRPLAAPAIAQSAPELKWRMTSSFPKALDTIYGAAETFAKFVAEATDGNSRSRFSRPARSFPALQAADAVADGTVEMCHTATYYYWGKDPTFAFGTAVPFGLNNRMQNAWMYEGGGIDLMNEFYAKHNIHRLPARQYRRPDGRLVPQGDQVPRRPEGPQDADRRLRRQGHRQARRRAAADRRRRNLPALEKGTIDAAEWVGPYDDEKLGFHKVAPYYYYPGWWEGGAMLHVHVNNGQVGELPKATRRSQRPPRRPPIRHDGEVRCLNPAALKKLVAGGAQLRPFPQDVLEACFNAANETYAEITANNADFKKVLRAMKAFRADVSLAAGLGIPLRQLHDGAAAQEGAVEGGNLPLFPLAYSTSITPAASTIAAAGGGNVDFDPVKSRWTPGPSIQGGDQPGKGDEHPPPG